MRALEIAKWQDNIAEDIEQGKLNLNENLLNSLLEVAYQLAAIREDWLRGRFKQNVAAPKIEVPVHIGTAKTYYLTVFGLKIPIGLTLHHMA